MKVLFDDRIKGVSELLSLVQQATPQLEAVVGPSHGEAQAEWGYEEESGRKWATLQIRASLDEVKARLAPEELSKTSRLRIRLLRLWGSLLQARTHRLIQDVLDETGASGEDSRPARRRERRGKQMARRLDRRRKSARRDIARSRGRASRTDRSPGEAAAKIASDLDTLAQEIALLQQRCAHLKATWEKRRRRWLVLGPIVGGLIGGAMGTIFNYFLPGG